jgi:hypothetical protein
MNKIPQYDKMDLKKKCLDIWKIPVLNYDENKLLTNRFKRPDIKFGNSNFNSNKFRNKPKTLKETAYIYSDYDKNSDSMQNFLNIFDKGSNNVIRFDKNNCKDMKQNKIQELDDLLYNSKVNDVDDTGIEKLLGRKKDKKNNNNNNKNKQKNSKENNYSSYNYKEREKDKDKDIFEDNDEDKDNFKFNKIYNHNSNYKFNINFISICIN